MWNLDRRRWEKGASASEMEAFIFLFCWSANVLKGKEKARREKLISKKRNHLYQTTQWSLFHPLVWYNWLAEASVYCIHQWRYGRLILCACSFTFLLPEIFLRGKLYFFFDSHLQMQFSSCIICEESTCVIMDKVFHSLSVFFYCCYVSVSVKRTTLERDHCSGSRCQWRRGHS